jgi:ribonuclease PH
MNVVMNGVGDMIEVQATAEGEVFSREQLEELLDLSSEGIAALVQIQKDHI